MKIQCGKQELCLAQPQVMGILNVTPDSFSDGGSVHKHNKLSVDKALFKAEKMMCEGARIIDVGGESTRPGASRVLIDEELERVLPVIEAISKNLDVIISVDTSQPSVITEAAKRGAGLINDVRALQLKGALEAAAQTQLPVCLMHMQGDPATMQHNPEYVNCVPEVLEFLRQRIEQCQKAGISPNRILVDPGIGFGKKDAHNLELLKQLNQFTDIGAGVLFGISRKSMIGRLLKRDLPDRLPGSLGFGLVALQQGAKILRVHDVAATTDIVKIHLLMN